MRVEAAKIIKKLLVETCSSIQRTELIFNQMWLCLVTKDFILKKISTRFSEDAKLKLKLKLYRYMIELGQHEGDYLEICRNFRQVYNTQKVDNLKIVLYIVLANFDNEQSELIHR